MSFTAAHVAGFKAYSATLDDAILDQRLAPAFHFYARYVERVAERTAHARALLAKGFDFSVDENYRFDREDAAWAKAFQSAKMEFRDEWGRVLTFNAGQPWITAVGLANMVTFSGPPAVTPVGT